MQSTTIPEAAATVQWHDETWLTTIRRVSELAQSRLPEALHGRIQRATALVLHGGVWLEEDGRECQVRASDGQIWYSANGHCGCEDYQRAPDHLCKHRLARGIYVRAGELQREAPTAGVAEVLPAAATPPQTHGIPAQYIVLIQGRMFVKFAGLLKLAHEQGLVELQATWVYNDAELSLASAVAIFEDGKRFQESGDATPENVTKKVAPHFRRVALTRAKSRALRDALNCELVAVEELGEGE